MRTPLLASLLIALALSGCTTVDIDDPDAEATAAAQRFAEDTGPDGDLARIHMTMDMAMASDDFQMEMGLASTTTFLQGDALRMTAGVTRAVFDGDDNTEQMADVEIFVACDPTTLTFRLTGMEAMGGEDVEGTVANELGTCLDAGDPEDLARMIDDSEGMDGQFAGFMSQMLTANQALEMEPTSAKVVDGVVEATYAVEFEGIAMEMVATVDGGRITESRMDYAVEEIGMTTSLHATYAYGPRAAA